MSRRRSLALPFTNRRQPTVFIPQALETGKSAASFGCLGNRVYTQAPDDEAYYAIPGTVLEKLSLALKTIAKANEALEGFHKERAAAAA